MQLNQAQFDALVSYTYNTTHRAQVLVFATINQGDFEAAAGHISHAVKVVIGSGKGRKLVVAPGLFRRRAEESAPFRSMR